MVSGGNDDTVRTWRLTDGAPVSEPATGHDGTAYGVTTGVLPDGTPVVVSGGEDGTVRTWRLTDGTAVGEPFTGPYGRSASRPR